MFGIPLVLAVIGWGARLSSSVLEAALRSILRRCCAAQPHPTLRQRLAGFGMILVAFYGHAVVVYSSEEEWSALDATYCKP